ncbi:unnamed protein product [Ectocarpus sp. CCAP 1310/34]|nr:unnamed protein product [Ectocarpus sp. CCAP 1310/34]
MGIDRSIRLAATMSESMANTPSSDRVTLWWQRSTALIPFMKEETAVAKPE